MPEDLKLSQISSSPLPPPFRGLHSPGVRKHCQIIFACYFRISSIRNSFPPTNPTQKLWTKPPTLANSHRQPHQSLNKLFREFTRKLPPNHTHDLDAIPTKLPMKPGCSPPWNHQHHQHHQHFPGFWCCATRLQKSYRQTLNKINPLTKSY